MASQPIIEPRSIAEDHLARASQVEPRSSPNGLPSSLHNGHLNSDPFQTSIAIDPILAFQQVQSGTPLDHLAGVASLIGAPSAPSSTARISPVSGSPVATDTTSNTSIQSPDSGLGLVYDAWPKNLPDPTFLRHL